VISNAGRTVSGVQASARRGIDELRRLVDHGLGIDEFRAESLRRLRTLISIDAAFYATVDHATMLMTSALSEEPLVAAAALFLDNEYGVADVNKFVDIAAGDPVVSLDGSTRGERGSSARFRDLIAPMGLGDEVRIALHSRGRCWGVMCLHRESADHGFSDEELALLREIAPILGEGLRRATALTCMTAGVPIDGGPGVLILGADLSVISTNPQADRWLDAVDDRDWPSSVHLPVAVLSAATSLLDEDDNRVRRARLRMSGGGWMTVHASPLNGDHTGTVVVLDTPEPEDLTSLALAAHGLTSAQTRVATLVLRGRSTQQIVNELGISANTVQEHLRAVFDRFGVGSRRELVASLISRPAAGG
jgi:DNA-binding CsgD family transcriptional regulator